MKDSGSYKSFMRSPYRSIKHSTYFTVYDELFSKFKGKRITFVEIGVLNGGSLFMWRDFFGPNARIIGVDLNEKAKYLKEHGFEIFIGNQSSKNFWDGFIKEVGPIDIVLDDGGHTYDQQIFTLELLLKNINDGGLLVFEDTHTSYLDGYGPKKYSFIAYTKRLVDLINHRHGILDKKNAEYRVWSIQVFESIVAFRVKMKSTLMISSTVQNSGEVLHWEDARYSSVGELKYFHLLSKHLTWLRRVPGSLPLARFIRHCILILFSRSKKFF